MPRAPLRHLLALLAALALVGAACAGDDGSTATGDGPDATAPEPDPTTTTGPEGDEDEEQGDPTSAPVGEVATSDPVASAGCGTSTVGAVELEQRDLPDDRYYLLTTPTAHDGETPVPLVLDFHGLSEGAAVHAQHSLLGPYADQEGFAVAFPHGTGSPVRWGTDTDRAGNPDLVYTEAVLDQLEADLCIDTSRVYVTGLSNGAMMSSTIACTLADRVAAVAPVAGVTAPEVCEPARPVPAHAFHGTADPILLFNGGVDLGALSGDGADPDDLPEPDLDGEGYPAAAAAWAERNGCDPDPTDTEVTDTVLRRSWDCPTGAAVVFDVLDGHGHGWPGSAFSVGIESIVGPTDLSIDANEEMWRFFQRFALPEA